MKRMNMERSRMQDVTEVLFVGENNKCATLTECNYTVLFYEAVEGETQSPEFY